MFDHCGHQRKQHQPRVTDNGAWLYFKDIVLITDIFWLFRTCSASFDHLIGEKTRMYFAKRVCPTLL